MGAKAGRSSSNTGRKSAYVARNRRALVLATQEVLATVGPEATIDEVAAQAQVSVSTIYQHFESKDVLFSFAISSAMSEWQEWALILAGTVADPLGQLILPMRLLMRIKQTHPLYASLITNNLSSIPALTPALASGLLSHVKELSRMGVLNIDHLELRVRNFSACMFEGIGNQLINPTAKPAEADISVEIALGILGVSEAKAKKFAHAKLPRLTVIQAK